MDKAIFFRKTESIRAEIDKAYDDTRELIHESHDNNIRKLLNETISLLSDARQSLYNVDSFIEKKD